MNKDVIFSSKSDMWETPQYFFDKLDEKFHFDIDVCATKENAKCKKYYTREQDGLLQEWQGTCWCNPPYGREIIKWVRKASISAKNGATVVMLVPARTDTKWFHEYIYKKEKVKIKFIKGRLKFGNEKNPAPFPSMLVLFESFK
nr:MAG TPA: DNA N-6-adenine-methyltransferase [Caudoviricetes sp.]